MVERDLGLKGRGKTRGEGSGKFSLVEMGREREGDGGKEGWIRRR